MKLYTILKWTRRVLAVAVIALITYFFIFSSANATGIWAALLKVQFIPGVLGITTGGALTVTVILLLTLLFGRVYCSMLCPLGIYQDIVNRIAWFIKSRQKRRTHYSKPNDGIRYGILAFVTVCVVFGFTYPLVWLDPYSLFGKMAVNLGRPLVAGITGAEYYTWSWPAFAFAAAFFTFITLLAAFRGRYYCNTICPAGTLLGLVSKISMFRIQVNESECRHCLLCGKSCKSYCLDSSGIKVDHSRCVVCLNCIGSCNTKAVTYAFAWKKKVAIVRKKEEPTAENKGRRAFLISALGAGVSAGAGVVLLNRFKGKARVKVGAGLPPGAGNLERLQDKCIACHACVAACPSHIIKPAYGELGWQGFLLPSVSYENGFCGFECQKCQEVCPSGALQRMSLEDKKLTKLGVARFTLENCIVYKDGTDCGACDEHCPVKAVAMMPREGSDKLFPKVTPKVCIGCGGCEYICPARPKAIVVIPMAEQRRADAPLIDVQIKVDIEGFGF
ncbi:MAG: 4Fe-4S dicluster domain-containing protein [Bacteroidales bacterium]|jgi:polyferredoxin|nr:4Fe-4S binding protein [Bacteroidales bacterium]MDD4655013.1 4Fe-4S binding protein [Bacteroidales bacterium]